MNKAITVSVVVLSLMITVASGFLFHDEPTYIEKAVTEGDISICENINTDRVKQFCVDKVFYSKAVASDKSEYCLAITSEDTRSNCLSDLNN